jgi:phosphatidylinositol alpha 1,6-mannosyltransferase
LRIAFFTETFLPKLDGVTNTLRYLLEHLAARGHTGLMFAPQSAPARYATTSIVRLSGFTFPLYPELKLVPPLVDVKQKRAAFRPDLVHLVNPVSLGLGWRPCDSRDNGRRGFGDRRNGEGGMPRTSRGHQL